MSEHEHLYKPARKYCVINDGDGVEKDPDLTPVVLRLPSPPNIKTIKNYGFHPDQQVYKRDVVPPKLLQLEQQVLEELQANHEKNKNDIINGYKMVTLFWKKLSELSSEYTKEIQFIKHVQWKRVYGEWVYIDGRPIWIPPWHYAMLNWWYMAASKDTGGYPEFRIRDWKSFVFKHYLYTTKETFKDIDEDGRAVKNDKGEYEMVQLPVRVFYGDIQPKNRQSGATHQAICSEHEILVHGLGRHGTMVSKSVTDLDNHWDEKFIPAWQRQPLFMKPIWKGNNEPAVRLEWKAPSNVFGVKSLGSSFFIPKTTSEGVVDSMTIDTILNDEQGKMTGGGRVDVESRYNTTKQSLSTGAGAKIRGFMFNPSTVEEMDDGGKEYYSMCEASRFYIRNATGQTSSGLGLIYFPAQYCLEGFIDRFGMAVVGNPTERQVKLNQGTIFASLGVGAREYLLSSRDALLKKKTASAEKQYREMIRKQPMRYAESWMGGGGDIGFEMERLDRRLAVSRKHNDGLAWVREGEFYRIGGDDGQVHWRDKKGGKFELSYNPPMDMTNLQTTKPMFDIFHNKWMQHKAPIDPFIIIGADPFAFENRSKAKLREGNSAKSDGGIAGYYPFDYRVDLDDTPLEERQSDRFILSYREREPQHVYHEDVLMACIYLNALCYPEYNVKDLAEYFIKRGYGRYLKFDINPMTGKVKDTPGYHMGGDTKNEMFNSINAYLERNVEREKHIKFLRECVEIRHIDELNKFDRLAAHGAAIMGAKTLRIAEKKKDEEHTIEQAYSKLFGLSG